MWGNNLEDVGEQSEDLGEQSVEDVGEQSESLRELFGLFFSPIFTTQRVL